MLDDRTITLLKKHHRFYKMKVGFIKAEGAHQKNKSPADQFNLFYGLVI